MSVRTDVINLNVNINGNKAQNDLNDLRKKAADVKLEMQSLKKGTEEYIAKKKELAGITQEMAALKKQIGITALSQKELVAELNKLKALRGSVVPFTKEYKDLSESIAKVEKRLYDVKNGVQGFASTFSKVSAEIKQFTVLAAGAMALQFVVTQFKNVISGGAKLSNQLADIRRVTGLTAEEVEELNKQLNKLNTTTSGEGLRQIAIIAGKLGIAKQDIFGFTAAVDKLVVSLGDELGDADQITTQLGKIINVFDKTGKVTGDNILRAGNALVSLANSGVASGAFIVDFTQRLAGLAKTANLSIEASFGLGAALEELGQRSESSSTAIIKVLGSIGKDVPKFAKIAGMSVEAFTEILRKSPEEALIRLSEALVKGKVGFDEISKAFDAAGEDGARVVTTLGVIGGKAEFVRDKIRDAGTALQETNEITEAFALKNETFGATLDKIGNKITNFVTNSWLAKFFHTVAKGVEVLIDALTGLPKFIEENRNALLTLAAGLILLNKQLIISALVTMRDTAAKWFNVAATRAMAVTTTIAGVAQTSYAIIVSALTGKITLATAAQRLWNVAMSIGAGPIGILLTVIGALVVGIGVLTKSMTGLSAAQKINLEVQKRVGEETASEINKIEMLVKVINSNTASLDNKKKALNALIAISPEYLKGLTLENIATAEGKRIIDEYIGALKKKREIQAKQAVLEEALTQREKDFAEVRREAMKKGITLTNDEIEDFVLKPYAESAKKYGEATAGAISVILRSAQGVFGSMRGDLKNNLEVVKTLSTEMDEIAAKDVTKVITDTPLPTGNSADTIKAIDERIKALREEQDAVSTTRKEFDKYQKQINELERQRRAITGEKGKDKTGDDLKRDLENFKKEVEKLRHDMQLNGKTADEQEVIRVEQKYAELLAKAKKFSYAQLEIEGFKQKELDTIFKKQVEKRNEDLLTGDYDDDVAALEEYYRKVARQRAVDYADGRMSKEQYDEKIKEDERKHLSDRISLAGDYSGTVKKAAADITAFTKTQQEQQTADLVTETDKRIAKTNEEKLAAAQRKVLTTRKGSDANVNARKDEMKERFRQETQYLDKRSELYLLKEAELQENLKEIDKEALEGRLGRLLEWMNLVGQAFQSLNDIVKNIEERGLQRDRKNNEKKKDGYKKQLDSKLINQAQYDRKVAAADAEMDRKEKEAKRRQAKRDKAIAIFQALINTGAAIMQTWARWGFPQGLPFAIAQGVAGALQIGAIASAPLPELGKGDWVRTGDKHSDKSGGIPAMIERNEAVVSAPAMTDRDVVTVTGNTAQITSALNSRRGGRSWATGAKVVQMPAWVTQRPAAINSNVPGILKQGAFNGNTSSSNNSSGDMQQMVELNKAMLIEMQSNTEEIKTMKKNLKAFVVIKEFREEESKYDAAKNAAGVKQG
jgi:TP901 family phage tail tape measure protein